MQSFDGDTSFCILWGEIQRSRIAGFCGKTFKLIIHGCMYIDPAPNFMLVISTMGVRQSGEEEEVEGMGCLHPPNVALHLGSNLFSGKHKY